jgi:hypothetical protein
MRRSNESRNPVREHATIVASGRFGALANNRHVNAAQSEDYLAYTSKLEEIS